MRLERPLTLDMLDLVREILNPRLAVEDADGNPIGTVTRLQERLTNDPMKIFAPQQLNLLPSDEEETKPAAPLEPEIRLVRGVAGSGKTLVLIRRARRIVEQYPEAKVLVMAFNVEIATDLKKRIALPEESLEVINFHKICSRILG